MLIHLFNWKKKKLNIEICVFSLLENSEDLRAAFSAWLFGCPQDCLSPRNYTGPLTSYICWNEAPLRRTFFKILYENDDKNKQKHSKEIFKTSNLCNQIICRPSQSRETIPLKNLHFQLYYEIWGKFYYQLVQRCTVYRIALSSV